MSSKVKIVVILVFYSVHLSAGIMTAEFARVQGMIFARLLNGNNQPGVSTNQQDFSADTVGSADIPSEDTKSDAERAVAQDQDVDQLFGKKTQNNDSMEAQSVSNGFSMLFSQPVSHRNRARK